MTVTDQVLADDSIMLVTPRKLAAKEQSSDDDPRFGKVDPVGVVSPAMRRLKSHAADMSDTPPSSDDSIMSNSPSREAVKRRIARLPGSANKGPMWSAPSPWARRGRTSALVIDLTKADDDD